MYSACDIFSTNGTYLNWGKLKKNGPETKICHGDILSLAAPPQHGNLILSTTSRTFWIFND